MWGSHPVTLEVKVGVTTEAGEGSTSSPESQERLHLPSGTGPFPFWSSQGHWGWGPRGGDGSSVIKGILQKNTFERAIHGSAARGPHPSGRPGGWSPRADFTCPARRLHLPGPPRFKAAERPERPPPATPSRGRGPGMG